MEPIVLKSDFDTLVGLEARAVTERLNGYARKLAVPLSWQGQSMIQRQLFASRPMPLNFWKGRMPSTSGRTTEFAQIRNYGSARSADCRTADLDTFPAVHVEQWVWRPSLIGPTSPISSSQLLAPPSAGLFSRRYLHIRMRRGW